MLAFQMIRGDESVADVVTLPNGKCVVSWPTSTIVYDSEFDARMVHIEHMGGRGERTRWACVLIDKPTERGWMECYQDRCEGIPDRLTKAGGVVAPDYIPEPEREAFVQGYESCYMDLWGAPALRTNPPPGAGDEGGDRG